MFFAMCPSIDTLFAMVKPFFDICLVENNTLF